MRNLTLILSLVLCGVGGCTSAPSNGAVDLSANDGCAPPNVWRYMGPGCDTAAMPVCGSPVQDQCLGLVCSCKGKVIGGCDYFAEPWAYYLNSRSGQVGDSCSPLDAH